MAQVPGGLQAVQISSPGDALRDPHRLNLGRGGHWR